MVNIMCSVCTTRALPVEMCQAEVMSKVAQIEDKKNAPIEACPQVFIHSIGAFCEDQSKLNNNVNNNN